jgi:hypothetical protein
MDEINWTQEQMLEVGLKEPDDFIKSLVPLKNHRALLDPPLASAPVSN